MDLDLSRRSQPFTFLGAAAPVYEMPIAKSVAVEFEAWLKPLPNSLATIFVAEQPEGPVLRIVSNAAYQKKAERNYMIAGGAALVVGALAGVVIGRATKR